MVGQVLGGDGRRAGEVLWRLAAMACSLSHRQQLPANASGSACFIASSRKAAKAFRWKAEAYEAHGKAAEYAAHASGVKPGNS